MTNESEALEAAAETLRDLQFLDLIDACRELEPLLLKQSEPISEGVLTGSQWLRLQAERLEKMDVAIDRFRSALNAVKPNEVTE